jgi:hypothetical protein
VRVHARWQQLWSLATTRAEPSLRAKAFSELKTNAFSVEQCALIEHLERVLHCSPFSHMTALVD